MARGLAMVLVAAIGPAVGLAQGETRFTTPGGGAWGDPANWSAGVPTADDLALFDVAGGVVDLGGGVGSSRDLRIEAPDVQFTGGTLATTYLYYVSGSTSWSGPVIAGPLTSSSNGLWLATDRALTTATNPLNVQGPIVGGGFGVQLAGSVRLTGQNTYTGSTYAMLGAGYSVLTDGGRLAGTSDVGFYGGSLVLRNFEQNSQDRINDAAALSFSLGRLEIWRNADAASERVGGIHLLSSGEITFSSSGGAFVLSAPTLTRDKHAVGSFDLNNGRIILDTVPTHSGGGSGLTSKAILPYLGQMLYDAGPDLVDPADDVGLRALGASELETTMPAAGGTDAGPNVLITTPQSISGVVRVNSLSMSSQIDMDGAELHIAGGYLKWGASFTGTGSIHAPGELIVSAPRGRALNQPITAQSLTLTGSLAILSAANTLPGGVYSHGDLRVANPAALGAGKLQFCGETLSFMSAMEIPNDIAFGRPDLPRAQQMVNQYSRYFLDSYGQTITLNGQITGECVSIATNTGGSLRINGDASFKALMLSSFDWVEINGTVSGANPGTYSEASVYGTNLFGNGSLIGIFSSGSISPGIQGSAGRLTIQFMGDATYIVDLDGPAAGSTYDQLVVLKSVPASALDGYKTLHLQVDLGYVPSLGDEFLVMDNRFVGPSALFLGLGEGARFAAGGTEFSISYLAGDGNDVSITVVPEPVAIATISMAGMLVLPRRPRSLLR